MNVILLLAVTALGFIDGEPTPPAAGMTPEDRKALRADLHALAVGFGVEAPPPDEGAKEVADEAAMAKVSDRALTLLEKSISTAAAGVERAAPQVWRVAIRQQYAKAVAPVIAPLGWFVGLFACALFVYRKARKWLHGPEVWSEHPGPLCVTCVLVLMVAIPGGILLAKLTDSALYLINPEWYALRDLVQLLLGKQVG